MWGMQSCQSVGMKFEVGEKKALKLDYFWNYLGVWVWTGEMC